MLVRRALADGVEAGLVVTERLAPGSPFVIPNPDHPGPALSPLQLPAATALQQAVDARAFSVTLLDGDVVRKHLSSELGFSKEHRDINIKRIGYVASEITKNGGIAICAPIAPYTATRRAVREMVEAAGAFVEVHVATPLEECERRDRKGLYKQAREGKIKEFTGISDPYEEPVNPELRVDTSDIDVDNAAHQVLLKLEQMGLIGTS